MSVSKFFSGLFVIIGLLLFVLSGGCTIMFGGMMGGFSLFFGTPGIFISLIILLGGLKSFLPKSISAGLYKFTGWIMVSASTA